MELIYDYREKYVYDLLKKTLAKYNKHNIELVSKNLEIGDFVIGNLIIERKTHQDLASSILDGRYKEQSNRLLQYKNENPNSKIVYFIEGNFDLFFNNHNIDKDKLISCIMSLFYEKGFYIIMTKHLNETCDFLLKFCIKYHTKYKNTSLSLIGGENNTQDISQNNTVIQDYCFQNSSVHKKSSQIDKTNIGCLMLSNIPNVSMNISTQLLEPFDNNLIDFLNKIKEEETYLDTLKLKTKSGKLVKLSKAVITNIKTLLL